MRTHFEPVKITLDVVTFGIKILKIRPIEYRCRLWHPGV
jgi:hypothetical protein